MKREIMELSGIILEAKNDYEIYHNTYTSAVKEAESFL